MTYTGKNHKISKSNPNSHKDGWVFYKHNGQFAFFINASDNWIADNYKTL